LRISAIQGLFTRRAVLAFLLTFSAVCALPAISWYAQGEWEYYVLCDDSYRPDIRLASNEITVFRDLGDGRVIIRSVARLIDTHRGAALPVPEPEGWEGSGRRWYEGNEAKSAQLASLAKTILGDESAVEGAVEKLSVWVRNRVSYSLGVSMDPLEVVKNGRAFCEGYANLMVALLREAGIPAEKISGEILPGNGWGSNDSGGGHAFVTYYYPGIGWLCHDPQASSGFIDPYHLINFRGKAYAQYRQSPEVFVTGFDEEPRGWETYVVAADRQNVRGFAVWTGDAKGEGFWHRVRLERAGLDLEPNNSYATNVFGASWKNYRSKNSISVTVDGEKVSASVADSRWTSYLTPKQIWPESGDETVSVTGKACFGFMNLKNEPKGLTKAAFDFSGDGAMTVILGDPATGKRLARQKLDVTVSGVRKGLTADADGCVYFIFMDGTGKPLEGLEILIEGLGEPISALYRPGASVRVPAPEASVSAGSHAGPAISGIAAGPAAGAESSDGALVEAIARERGGSATPLVTFVAKNREGLVDPSIVSSACLVEGTREIRLAARPEGYFASAGLESGKGYAFFAVVDGVNVRRDIGPLEPGAPCDLEYSARNTNPSRIARANPFESSPYLLYDYGMNHSGGRRLYARGNEVLMDAEGQVVCVADNKDAMNVCGYQLEAGKEYLYNPGAIPVGILGACQGLFRWGTQTSLALRVIQGGKRLRDGTVYLVDRTDSSVTTLSPDVYGNYSGKALDVSHEYAFVYARPGALAMAALRLDENGGRQEEIVLPDYGFKCGTATRRYSSKGAAETVQFLLPPKGGDDASLRALALKTGSSFTVYADAGTYVLSTDVSPMGATTVSSGSMNGDASFDSWHSLRPDPSAKDFAERGKRAVSALYPEARSLVCLSFKDPNLKARKPAIDIALEGMPIKPAFDSLGFLVLSLKDGAKGSFSYRRNGLYWTGVFTRGGEGPEPLELSPSPARTLSVQSASGQQLRLLVPVEKGGRFDVGEIPLVPEGKGEFAIETPPGKVWLKWTDGKILERAVPGPKITDADRDKGDQASAWLSFFNANDPGGTRRILDVRGLKAGAEPSFRDGNGKIPASVKPIRGLYIFQDPAMTSLEMSLVEPGSYRLARWGELAAGNSVLSLPATSVPSCSVSVFGADKKPRGTLITLYEGGVQDGASVKGYSSRISLQTTPTGKLALYIPKGTWWLCAKGVCRQVVLAGGTTQPVSLTVK